MLLPTGTWVIAPTLAASGFHLDEFFVAANPRRFACGYVTTGATDSVAARNLQTAKGAAIPCA